MPIIPKLAKASYNSQDDSVTSNVDNKDGKPTHSLFILNQSIIESAVHIHKEINKGKYVTITANKIVPAISDFTYFDTIPILGYLKTNQGINQYILCVCKKDNKVVITLPDKERSITDELIVTKFLDGKNGYAIVTDKTNTINLKVPLELRSEYVYTMNRNVKQVEQNISEINIESLIEWSDILTQANCKLDYQNYDPDEFPDISKYPKLTPSKKYPQTKNNYGSVDIWNTWVEPSDIYYLLDGNEKQQNMVKLWFKKNPKAIRYWQNGHWYHSDDDIRKARYPKFDTDKSNFKEVPYNVIMRELIAEYGLNSGIFKQACEFTLPITQKDIQPICNPFYDTFIVQNRSDCDNNAKTTGAMSFYFGEKIVKPLEYVSEGYICHSSNINPEKLTGFFTKFGGDIHLVSADYTCDYSGCINTSYDDLKKDVFNTSNEYDKSLSKMYKSQVPTLYKGKFTFKKGEQFCDITFKIYDKIHSFFNNAGMNSVGLTVYKALLEPREKHIEQYLNNSERLKQKSIVRIEVTIKDRNFIAHKDEILKQCEYYASPLICLGDVEKWGNQYFLNTYPQVVIDASALNLKQIKDSYSWLCEEYWDEQYEQKRYRGRILVAYWIEGSKSKLKNKEFKFGSACIAGLYVDNLDIALQRCLGNRPIALITLNSEWSVETVKYYGVDKAFKPIPAQGESEKYTGRGLDKPIPKLFETTFPFTNSYTNHKDRKCNEISRKSLTDNYYKLCDENELEHYAKNLVKESVTKQIVTEITNSHIAVTDFKKIPMLYRDRLKPALIPVAKYMLVGRQVGNKIVHFPVFITPTGKMYRTKNKSRSKEPKYFYTGTGNYRKCR